MLTPQSSPIKSSFPASSILSRTQPQTQTRTQISSQRMMPPPTPFMNTIALPPLPITFPSSRSQSYSSRTNAVAPGRAGALRVQTHLSIPSPSTTVGIGMRPSTIASPLTPPPFGFEEVNKSAEGGFELAVEGEGRGEVEEGGGEDEIRRSIERLVTDDVYDGMGGEERETAGQVMRARSMTMSSTTSTASLGSMINAFPLPPFLNSNSNGLSFPRSAPAMGMRTNQFLPSPPSSASVSSFNINVPPRSAPASTYTTRFPVQAQAPVLGMGIQHQHQYQRGQQQQQSFRNASQHVASIMGLPRLPTGLSGTGPLAFGGKLQTQDQSPMHMPPPSFPPRRSGPHPPFPSPSLQLSRPVPPFAQSHPQPSSQSQSQSQGQTANGGSANITSQSVLTPDGKALAGAYGPWTTVDVSPDPVGNSVVISWPVGYPLPR